MKEYNIPLKLTPEYNHDCTEIIFFIFSLSEIKFKDYFLSNNGKPTTNYKSIHFIINGKELYDEEIQTISLSDTNNEIIYYIK